MNKVIPLFHAITQPANLAIELTADELEEAAHALAELEQFGFRLSVRARSIWATQDHADPIIIGAPRVRPEYWPVPKGCSFRPLDRSHHRDRVILDIQATFWPCIALLRARGAVDNA